MPSQRSSTLVRFSSHLSIAASWAFCSQLASLFAGTNDSSSPSNAPCIYADQQVDGYGENIKWKDAPVHDFGPRKVIFDTQGMRSLSTIPPPGVHPRIYFNKEDIRAIRDHFLNTESGKLMWNVILCWTECLKGSYKPDAPYTKPDFWNGFNGWVHGPAPIMSMQCGDSPLYGKLISGDTNVSVSDTLWGAFSMEALRCLISNDEKGARNLASAVITAMQIGQKNRADQMAKDHKSGPPGMPVGGGDLGHVYDMIYQWLTPEQRQAMHDELVQGTSFTAQYGTFEDATAARSTWATFCHHVIPLLAIEGESGFNKIKLDSCYRAWRNYITYSINRSGCIYEGEGKLILGAGAVLAFTRHPDYAPLGAHPHLRRYADYFLPHDVNAPQNGFLSFDLLGGPMGHPNSVDIVLMHYLYPNDPRIAWVYQETVGANYRQVPAGVDPWGMMNCGLFGALFTTDLATNAIDPAGLNLGNTFFDGERALMMTRSDWSTNALQLTMQTRQVSGGHPYADRNSIQVLGNGRIWSGVNGSEMFENECQSVVVIDHHPQSYHVPGRVVDFQDKPQATFIVGDAKYNWDWTWDDGIIGHGWNFTAKEVNDGVIQAHMKAGFEPEPHCAADFHFTCRDDPAETGQLFLHPTWLGIKGIVNPIVRGPNYPVKKAFRTAGLVRGSHPYVIVLDDIQKDESVHHYEWLLQLEPDLQIVSNEKPKGSDGLCDVILQGNTPKQDAGDTNQALILPLPNLLVRLLERNQDPKVPLNQGSAYLSDIKAGTWNRDLHRLVIPSDSVSPDYKALIFSHRKGDVLPVTTWNSDHTKLRVSWPDQEDELTFAKTPIGKTDFTISRLNKGKSEELVSMNRPVLPLPDPVKEGDHQSAPNTVSFVENTPGADSQHASNSPTTAKK